MTSDQILQTFFVPDLAAISVIFRCILATPHFEIRKQQISLYFRIKRKNPSLSDEANQHSPQQGVNYPRFSQLFQGDLIAPSVEGNGQTDCTSSNIVEYNFVVQIFDKGKVAQEPRRPTRPELIPVSVA